MLRKIADAEKFDMSCWRTYKNVKWLNASRMRRSGDEYEQRDKQQSFDDDGDDRDEYPELF